MSTRGWYVLLLVAVWGLYFWSNAQAALLLACLLVFVLPLSIVENLLAARHIKVWVEIEKRREQQETGNLTVTVKTENKGILPAFRVHFLVEIQNRLTGSVYRLPYEMGVAPGGVSSHEFLIESLYCGRIDGEIKQAYVWDFLGFTSKKIPGKSRGGCYSYPQEGEQDVWEFAQYQKDELRQEEHYTHTKGNDITEILNLREYQKGDNIKTIHWKLSKKLGYKVVKELDMPASQDVILLMALSHDHVEQENLRHQVAQTILNISQVLLQEQIFYDAVLIRDRGASHGLYTIQEQKTRDWYQQILLEGNMEWEQDYVEQYITSHHVLGKYARVILVTDEALEGWYQEHSQVIQICVS